MNPRKQPLAGPSASHVVDMPGRVPIGGSRRDWMGWAFAIGLTAGVSVLPQLLGHRVQAEELLSAPHVRCLFLALAPALLCALLARIAWTSSGPAMAGVVGLVGAPLAGAVCAPMTYVLLVMSNESLGFAHPAAELGGVTVFGGMMGAMFGAVIGCALAPLFELFAMLRRRAALASSDAWRVVAGLGWVAAGGVGVVFPSQTILAGSVSVGLVVSGTAMLIVGITDYVRRRRFVAGVRAGRIAGWRIRPESEEGVQPRPPRLFLRGEAGHVLERLTGHADGPFRDGRVAFPVARVP